MRKINEIILHCSATPENKNFTVEDITKWHKAKGWDGCGYHYVIHLDGTIHSGRPIGKAGAHCLGHNSNSIGICYIGGVDKSNKPKDTRTDAQKKSLVILVHELLAKYNLKLCQVHCHYEYAAKACPSFKLDAFKKEYLKIFKK